MSLSHYYDSIIIGSGPNGLAAAVRLAKAGARVVVFEAESIPGGGTRTRELTLPGYLHDVCSAIHPMAAGSPFFRSLPLQDYGLEWIYPEIDLAHPFDDGSAGCLVRSVSDTALTLGADADVYRELMEPLVEHWEELLPQLLGPLRFPSTPLKMASFGLMALQSARKFAESHFRGDKARGFFAGLASHSIMDLDKVSSSAIGLVLGLMGHTVGWPMPKGGSQKIAGALTGYLKSLGGELIAGERISSLKQLPPARTVIFDLTPRQILDIAGNRLSSSYRRKLERFRYGPGVCKVDWALSEPVPFFSHSCRKAGTIHIGGTLNEIVRSEKIVNAGGFADKPFVLLAQQSLFDPTRAPAGKHTGWAYCHVPNGSQKDVSQVIEDQIERFAPGFRDTILRKHVITASDFQQYNENYIGGDINGGAQDIRQLFTRPVTRLNPYKTSDDELFICSSSTPPGGGVHGMCGYHAAGTVLQKLQLG